MSGLFRNFGHLNLTTQEICLKSLSFHRFSHVDGFQYFTSDEINKEIDVVSYHCEKLRQYQNMQESCNKGDNCSEITFKVESSVALHEQVPYL